MKLTKIVIKDLTDYIPQFLGSRFYTTYLSPKIVHDEGYIIDFTGCTYLGWGFMRDLYIINKYRGGLVVTGLGDEMLNGLFKFWRSMRDGSSTYKDPKVNFEDKSNLIEGIFD
jgi:hypothetical protein